MTQIINSLAEIAADYDVLFCDLWGCLHNGVAPYPEAVAALQDFRKQGGRVVLMTNAPRPAPYVREQLDRMGVPRDAYDLIVSSGDAAQDAMFAGAVGRKVWAIAQPKDEGFFTDIPAEWQDAPAIQRVELDQAEGIVCCGPFDPHADPAVNRPAFLTARSRGLKLLCANPDMIVDRGESREWCAGAIAKLYDEMGGESLYFGKPHPPIYDLARQRLAEIAGLPDESRILCIGDGIGTDILGASGEGLDSLFITGGLAAAETLTATQPDPVALADWLAGHRLQPTYAIGFLR